jgi:phosphoribosylformylglycinamidine cyclo-ligase
VTDRHQRSNEGRDQAVSYRDAGVDIDAASSALSAIGQYAKSTIDNGSGGTPIGHFGGVYRLPAGPDRLIVASADGIGTKIKLAFILGGEAHHRVGSDLVNHCVNDLLACGARPLFFLDYVAMGKLEPNTLTSLVAGMAEACRENGVALIGGETAEMPGLYRDGEYDAAGFIVGEVPPDLFVDGSAIEIGDELIGLPAIGLHTNGYSLARRIVGLTGETEPDREILNRPLAGGEGETIGEALLSPHPSYLATVWPLLEAGYVRGMAHITGGGLIDNVPRMLPTGCDALIDPSRWRANPIFQYLVRSGPIDRQERYRAFNMGVGFVVAVPPAITSRVLEAVPNSIRIGEVVSSEDDSEPRVVGLA